MAVVNVTKAREEFASLIDRVAHHGERIILRRHGKDVVAIVSADDARFLEALEEHVDLEEALERLQDGQEPIPYEVARKQLGLT